MIKNIKDIKINENIEDIQMIKNIKDIKINENIEDIKMT